MRTLIRDHPAPAFFILAWSVSWVFMIPLALAAHGRMPPIPGWLHYLSAYGPLVAAALVTWANDGRAGLKAWSTRLRQVPRDQLSWALALSPVILYGAAFAAQRVVRHAGPDVTQLGSVNFLPYIGPFAILLWLFNSGLGEEAGWRGFALPTLRRRHSAVVASLIVAGGWMLWHIPAFFYLPSYIHFSAGMAVGFFLGILSGSFMLTWLVERTRFLALPAIVWHGLFNFTTAPPSSGLVIAPVISTATMIIGVLAAISLYRRSRASDGTTSVRPAA